MVAISARNSTTAVRSSGMGLIVFLLAAVLGNTGCNKPSSQAGPPKPPEVMVTTPITAKVTDYQDFTGRLDAIQSVEIKAHVTGYLISANFKEGAAVKEGDVLFEIDPRVFEAQLDQTEKILKRDKANLADAQATLSRTETAGQVAVSAQEIQQARTLVKSLTASVEASEAARDQAKVNLGYCKVYAPFSGIVSYRYVHPGNTVTADMTILTTLVTSNPVYAWFDVDERTYLDLVNAVTPKQNTWFSKLEFPVLMRLSNEDDYARLGIVDFIDNRVLATTGTVRLRGVFQNPLGVLKPGLFVRIRLPIGRPYSAILVPDEALQSDQGRRFVYILTDKDEVVYRPVKPGQAIQGLRVIKDGLKEGDRVIVVGIQRVRPGVTVNAKMQPPPRPPDSELTRELTAFLAKTSAGKASPAE